MKMQFLILKKRFRICLDTDGDRSGIVDQHGRIDYILMALTDTFF